MIKIKFNTTTSYFISVLMISLFSVLFCFMLCYTIINNLYDSSTIFPTVLFGIFDTIFIFSLSKSGNFIQELSIDENYVIFDCINGGKKQVISIRLDDIENFNVDIDIKYYTVRWHYYITNFSIKRKNSDEVQTIYGKLMGYSLKGLCSLFDIQEILPNFTYNITSNNEGLKNNLSYYAENKRFSETVTTNTKNLKWIVIIAIVIYFILLFFVVCASQ